MARLITCRGGEEEEAPPHYYMHNWWQLMREARLPSLGLLNWPPTADWTCTSVRGLWAAVAPCRGRSGHSSTMAHDAPTAHLLQGAELEHALHRPKDLCGAGRAAGGQGWWASYQQLTNEQAGRQAGRASRRRACPMDPPCEPPRLHMECQRVRGSTSLGACQQFPGRDFH